MSRENFRKSVHLAASRIGRHLIPAVGLLLMLSCPAKADLDPASITVHAAELSSEYRALVERIRNQVSFTIPLPDGVDWRVDTSLTLGDPIWADPITSEFDTFIAPVRRYRMFWDRIYTKIGSQLKLGDRLLPITCIFVEGQDNRAARTPNTSEPLLPEWVLKVFLVANDFSCVGPINPGFPDNGQPKERWDTYVYYEIRDPSIMLPTQVKLRYRWNEYAGVLNSAISGGTP